MCHPLFRGCSNGRTDRNSPAGGRGRSSEVAGAYLFGSMAEGSPHPLSDVDLAYLGTTGEAEDRVFDPLYEALQRELGEGGFDLVPLRRAPLHLQYAIATAGTLLFARDPI